MSVETFRLHDGLMITFKSSYWCFDSLNIVSLDEFLDNLLMMVLPNCFKVQGDYWKRH